MRTGSKRPAHRSGGKRCTGGSEGQSDEWLKRSGSMEKEVEYVMLEGVGHGFTDEQKQILQMKKDRGVPGESHEDQRIYPTGMILVEGGEFVMGKSCRTCRSNRALPAHLGFV